MAYPQQTINQARSAYVYDALNIESISERFNVPRSTVMRWKKTAAQNGDDWERARAAARLSGQGVEAVTAAVLEDFVLAFQVTMKEIKEDASLKPRERVDMLSSLADAYTKTINSIAKGNPKLDKLSFAAGLLGDLVQYIQTHYSQHAKAMEEVLVPFGEEIGKRYG